MGFKFQLIHLVSALALASCADPDAAQAPATSVPDSAASDAVLADASPSETSSRADVAADAVAAAETAPTDTADVAQDATARSDAIATVDAAKPDAAAAEVAAGPPAPTWTTANGCATPAPWTSPTCAQVACAAGKVCMGAGLCVPAATFLPPPPAGEAHISFPAPAAHESGAWALAVSAGVVDTGMRIYAQVYPQGDTTGNGWLKLSPADAVLHRMPSTCSLGPGGWLVVWRAEDELTQTVSYLGRVMTADGKAAPDPPFPLNTTLLGLGESNSSTNVVAPVVLRLRDDSVLAAWSGGVKGKGAQLGIFARRFTTAGVPLGQEIAVSPPIAGQQAASPGIAPLTGGEALLVWEFQSNGKKGDPVVQGRKLNGEGQLVGEAATLSPQLKAYEALPAVTGFADGAALVTWKVAEGKNATMAVDIMARRVSGEGPGATKGSLHKLDADATGTYPFRASAAAMVDGRAAVAWHNASIGPHTIQFSRYYPDQDAFDCQPTDVAGPLGAKEVGPRYLPEVAAFADHRLLVGWNTDFITANGAYSGVVALRFFGW